MLLIRIDPTTNKVTIDEPSSDTLTFQAETYRLAIAAAIDALATFGRLMDEQGIVNFDLSKP